MSVQSSRELDYGGEFVLKLSFGHKVFEFVDVFLESVVGGSVFILCWFLDKSGQVSSGLHFGVEGIKVQVIVFGEFREGFVFSFDGGVCHFVIPFLGEGHSLSGVHLAEDEGNL